MCIRGVPEEMGRFFFRAAFEEYNKEWDHAVKKMEKTKT